MIFQRLSLPIDYISLLQLFFTSHEDYQLVDCMHLCLSSCTARYQVINLISRLSPYYLCYCNNTINVNITITQNYLYPKVVFLPSNYYVIVETMALTLFAFIYNSSKVWFNKINGKVCMMCKPRCDILKSKA